MHEADDSGLLRQYAEHGSEEAFAMLVSRHVNKVYSVALRQTGKPHLAEEITQAVFVTLARNRHRLGRRVVLSGWLYQTARLTSITHIRSEIRRHRREMEASLQTDLNETEPDVWTQIAPLLDSAMGTLSEADRHAIVLRFFDGKNLREVGAAMGANEEAARKRVNRAVEKLRLFFTNRGVVVPAAMLTTVIAAHSVQAAPPMLAQSVSAAAMVKGATAIGSTWWAGKGALKIMAWSKAKIAAVVSVAALFTAGTAVVAVKAIQHYKEDAVWRKITAASFNQMEAAPPIISIRPAKLNAGFGIAWISDGRKQMAFNKSVGKLLQNAYGIREARIIYAGNLPEGTYDYIDTMKDHQQQALQEAIKKKFGLVGSKVLRDTNVWVVKVANPNPPAFKPTEHARSVNLNNAFAGHFIIQNEVMANVTHSLEAYLKIPLIDETGLEGRYDAELTWDATGPDHNPDELKKAAMEQFGLEFVPEHRTIEMLEVTSVR